MCNKMSGWFSGCLLFIVSCSENEIYFNHPKSTLAFVWDFWWWIWYLMFMFNPATDCSATSTVCIHQGGCTWSHYTTMAFIGRLSCLMWQSLCLVSQGECPSLPRLPPLFIDNRPVGSKMSHVPCCTINALFWPTFTRGTNRMTHFQQASSRFGQAVAMRYGWALATAESWCW